MSQVQSTPFEIGKVYTVNINELKPNPHQPRVYFDDAEINALAKDIDANGLLQNITFTRHEGELIIVSGERRVRAHKLLGKEVIEGKYIEGDLHSLALMENILRSDLTAVELAESVAALKEQKGCSSDDIVALIGKQKSTVSEILRVASLPENIRNDARTKPCMTRERLLKIARRKKEEDKDKAYAKLCVSLQDQIDSPEKSKPAPKLQQENTSKNRYVNAQIRLVKSMAVKLEDSHQKMLAHISGTMPEAEEQALSDALAQLKSAILKCFPQDIIPKKTDTASN